MGLKITLTKSFAGASADQLATLNGLGLKKMWRPKIVQDTPAIRGMVFKVAHLVSQEVVAQGPKVRKRIKPRRVRVRERAAGPAKKS